MPTKYSNLPGINLELLDGNLRIDDSITGPVALVIGTALSGPSGKQYLVRDSNAAAAVYGSDSPLIQKLAEVKLGGVKNVILYRIGGEAAELANLFGTDSLFATKEQTANAGSKYSVYIGPEPQNPAKDCIIAFEGDKIVHSTVAGAEVDLSKFTIVGFNQSFAYRVGTPTAPVLLKDVIANVRADSTLNDVGDGTKVDFDLPPVTGAIVKSVKVDNVALTTGWTLSAGAGAGGVDRVVFTVAPATAKTVVIEYSTPTTIAGATFKAGADNMACSWKKYYELLDAAYADLETTIATHVFVDRAVLDAPNIADGSVAVDRLEYLHKAEDYGVVTYTWATNKTLYAAAGDTTTTDVNLATLDANGRPIVAKKFHEVNFVHQLGEWAHSLSENERFILAAIGTSLPIATTTAAVAKHIGTLPQTDIDGVIIANGAGLLGNRFMVGSTTQKAGFYKTDAGFPDGNVQVDSNGAPIDLGKYLSVVAGAITTPNIGSLGSTSRMVNGAAVYLGLLSQIKAGDSTTNQLVPRVSSPFALKKIKLDELTGAGYVTFQDKTRGTVVVSGELATGPDSDYDYVSTSIIVGSIMGQIRERLDPFLGKGLNQVTIAAAETAVEDVFNQAVKAGAIIKFAFKVLVDPAERGRGKMRVPITIVPAFELREVNTSLKLAYDI